MSEMNAIEELPEDIEVIGPGQMLAEAREKQKLTQQQVADKLNFRTTLVKDIESEQFDKSLPDTFNRGYLKNYAKLVNISCEDVLASYEMLNVAKKQGAEMQSFSKQTEKQAESNRIMWISYLILATLVASTVVWWLQDAQEDSVKPVTQDALAKPTKVTNLRNSESTTLPVQETQQERQSLDAEAGIVTLSETLIDKPSTSDQTDENDPSEELSIEVAEPAVQPVNTADVTSNAVQEQSYAEAVVDYGPLENAQFTFSGDCWVNIYDATGERVAWGIKKTGYVMNLSGQAPFDITLGKPELVEILFEQQSIDMSQFSQGNIAKFTLPLAN